MLSARSLMELCPSLDDTEATLTSCPRWEGDKGLCSRLDSERETQRHAARLLNQSVDYWDCKSTLQHLLLWKRDEVM